MTVVAFDPTKHPRHPKGTSQGGEFRDKDSLVQPNRVAATRFPAGEFDPDGPVKFWPNRIARGLPIGRSEGGAAWKAWLDPISGKELAFWFVSPMGAPHHLDMADALGITPPSLDEVLVGPLRVSGYGPKTDMGWMASYFANDLGMQKDEMQRAEKLGNNLHSLIMNSVEEIPRRHRKDIKDANIMAVSPSMAASGFLDDARLLKAVDRLQRQYEKVYRRASRRAAVDYKAASTVVQAAGGPLPEEVVKAAALVESFLRLTGVARRELLREILNALLVIYGLNAEERAAELKAIAEYSKLLEQQVGVQAERLVAGVQDAAANVMLDSLHEGWSIPQTADALQEKIAGIAPWQATMLARTDLIALANGASQQRAVIVDSPELQFKTWLATPDERTRIDHRHAHGQTVPLTQPFTVGGEQLLYPGDPSASDGNVINCRCTVIYSKDAFGPAGIKQIVMKDDLAVSAAAWDEAEHPRHPAGTTRGGEFSGVPGTFAPDADVIFWPDKIGLENGDPLWKALLSEDGKVQAFWFTDRRGAPHHKGMEIDLGWQDDDLRPSWRLIKLSGYGEKLDVSEAKYQARYVARDRGVRNPALEESLLKQWEEVPRRFRRDIRDARIMAQGPMAAAAWDETKHPRHPEGTEEGGQFAPKRSGARYSGGEFRKGTISGDIREGLIDYFKKKDVFDPHATADRILPVGQPYFVAEIHPLRTNIKYGHVTSFKADATIRHPGTVVNPITGQDVPADMGGDFYVTIEYKAPIGKAGRPRPTKTTITEKTREQRATHKTGPSGLDASAFVEALHPRHPSGSERGGEFAPKTTTEILRGKDQNEAVPDLLAAIEKWPIGDPRLYAKAIIGEIPYKSEFSSEDLFVTKRDGELVGLARAQTYEDLTSGQKTMAGQTAAAVKGGGLPLFKAMVSTAAERGVGLAWLGTKGSAPLYDKLGIPKSEGGGYRLTPVQVQALSEDLFRLARASRKRKKREQLPLAASGEELVFWPEDWVLGELTAAAWDESKHTRHPAGTEQGGEFAPKGDLRGVRLLQEIDRQRAERAAKLGRTEPEYDPFLKGMWMADRDEYIFDPDDPYFSSPVWKAIRYDDGTWKFWIANRQGLPHHDQVNRRLGRRALEGELYSGDNLRTYGLGGDNPELGDVLARNAAKWRAAQDRASHALAAAGWVEVELREEDIVGILTAAGWDPADHPRHPAGSPEGGEFAPKGFYHGAMIARDEDDKAIGYQAFRMDRDIPGKHEGRTLAGPVRETYQEAAEDARQAQDAEQGTVENAAGAHVDWSEAEKEFKNWSEPLRPYYTEEQGYAPGYFDNLQAEAWASYQDWVNRELPKLEARLNGAQVPGLKITPQLNPQVDGDMDVAVDPERAADSGPDFEVTLPAAEGGMEPSFTVWTYPEGANKRHETDPDWFEQPEGVQVEEVLDITDTDFFPDGPDSDLAGDYARAVDAARAVPDEPGFVTIYRGMSDSEYDDWAEGNEIPLGKWFAGIPTSQFAQDINREPPNLYSFRVPRHMLMQTGEHEFQLKKKGRLSNGVIQPSQPMRASAETEIRDAMFALAAALSAAGFVEADHPRHPKGSERGGEFRAKNGSEVAHAEEPVDTSEHSTGPLQPGSTRSVLEKLVISGNQIVEPVLEAAKTIDQTMHWPAVPGEPGLKVGPGQRGKANQGVFWRYEHTLKPDRITLAPDGVNPVSGATHELGHYLDSLLGQDAWADPKYAGFEKGRDVWFNYSSRDAYGTLAPIVTAIKETDMHRELVGGAQGAEFQYGGRFFRPGPKHVQYLLTNEELVARSFEQYIAAKNPGSKLARTIRHAFSDMPRAFPPEYPGYLKGTDLERVNAAWERVLEERGLLKQRGLPTPKPFRDKDTQALYEARERKLKAHQTS